MNKIKRLLGHLGFKWCPNCGTERNIVIGYKYYEYWDCPHCDHLDRFDIPSITYRESKDVGIEVPEEVVEKLAVDALGYLIDEAHPPIKVKGGEITTHHIRCLDCGVGVGANDPEVWKRNRRRFVKAHWGHKKEEM